MTVEAPCCSIIENGVSGGYMKRRTKARAEDKRLVGKRVCYKPSCGKCPRLIVGRVLALVPAGKSARKLLPKGVAVSRLRSPDTSRFARYLMQEEDAERRLTLFYAPTLGSDVSLIGADELTDQKSIRKEQKRYRRALDKAREKERKAKQQKTDDYLARVGKRADEAEEKADRVVKRAREALTGAKREAKRQVAASKAAVEVAEALVEKLKNIDDVPKGSIEHAEAKLARAQEKHASIVEATERAVTSSQHRVKAAQERASELRVLARSRKRRAGEIAKARGHA